MRGWEGKEERNGERSVTQVSFLYLSTYPAQQDISNVLNDANVLV
jgi:hypothetical protein